MVEEALAKPGKAPALPIIAPEPQSKISQEITQSAKTETIFIPGYAFQPDQKLESKHAVKEQIFFFPAIEPQQKTSQKSNNISIPVLDSSPDLSISYTPDFDIFTPPKPAKETFKPRPRKTENPAPEQERPPGGFIPPFFLFIPPGGPKKKLTTLRKPKDVKVKFPRFVPVLNPIFIFWGKHAGGLMQKVGGKLRAFSEKGGEHAPAFPVPREPTPLDFPLNFILRGNRKKKNKKGVRTRKRKFFPFL